jgi:hypothetical protein
MLKMTVRTSYLWGGVGIRKVAAKEHLRGHPVAIKVDTYQMSDQHDTTHQKSGTEPKKTHEHSLEEQWQQLLAHLEQSKGRKLTEQEKHLARAQAEDFGDIA